MSDVFLYNVSLVKGLPQLGILTPRGLFLIFYRPSCRQDGLCASSQMTPSVCTLNGPLARIDAGIKESWQAQFGPYSRKVEETVFWPIDDDCEDVKGMPVCKGC